MTAKRKAELQRKLALAPVPKPPADLAERIKRDIPKPLMVDAEKERFRLRQSVAFNIRVAASIILLVSSVYLALHLLSAKFASPQESATMASAPAVAANTDSRATATAPIVMPANPPSAESINAKAKKENERKQIIVAEARQEPLALRPGDEQVASNAGGIADGRLDAPKPAAAPAAAVPPPPAAPSLAQAPASAAEKDDYAAPQRERASVAGATAKMAAFGFDIEVSAAPFDASKQIVRVSVDGARDAAADVAFNDDTVASWHTLTSDGTSLYEITLRPHTGPNDIIATARVNNMERVIKRSDLRSWSDASRRMKYAALAAALDAGVSPKDVAAKARAAGLDDLAAAADARGRSPR